MDVFNCKVRLGGSVTNEVPKFDVTASEVIVLRHLHGAESVVDIEPAYSDKRQHAEERERLSKSYGDSVIEELFGPAHRELPVNLPEIVGTSKRGPRRGSATVSAAELAA